MTKKEKTIKYILDSMSISKKTHEVLTEFFSKMSDGDFHNFMLDLKNKKTSLSFIIPLDEQHDEADLFKWLQDDIGVNPFQRLTYTTRTGLEYTTLEPTLVMDSIVKRAAQTQDKKASIPTGNKINSLTGQVTGESLSAKFTLPETFIHLGYGNVKVPDEFINVRGGDLGLGNALDKLLFTQGHASMEELKPYSTKNVTAKSLKAYFLASHLISTL